MLIRYGHALKHVVHADSAQTVVFLAVQPLAALVQLMCWVVDEQAWKTTRLCEQSRRCTETPSLTSTCEAFEASADTLFLLMGITVALMICKPLAIAGFAYTHAEVNTEFAEILDLRTIERAYDGVAMWSMCALFDLVALVTVAYRHGVWLLGSYAADLYPDSMDETGSGLFLWTWVSVCVGCAATAWALERVVRAILVARSEEVYPDSMDDETDSLILDTGAPSMTLEHF
jgi:hypothetical protein